MKYIYRLIKFLFGIDIEQLLLKNNTLQTINSSQATTIADISKKLDLSNEKLKEIEKLFNNKQKEFDSLKIESAEISKKNFEILAKLQIANQKTETIQQEKDSLTIEIENTKKTLNETNTKFNNLKLQYAELELNHKNIIDTKDQIVSALKIQIQQLQLVVEKINNTKNEANIAETNNSNKLQNEINSLKDKVTQSQVEIRSLKQTVGHLQSEAINNKSKDSNIVELKTKITKEEVTTNDLKENINSLQNKIEQTLQIETSATSIQLQLVEGVVIHKSANIGKRAKKTQENEENIFEYIGKFSYNLKQLNKQDSENFPDVFYPKLNTDILKWQVSKSTTTTGVTEPLLIEALQLLKEFAPDIEILQNISLSIKNREYSYRPDIGLFWQKFNLCVDIEIDEPYDLVSRKPLHYIGSADYLRNLYFISQGWVVVRFSEEQVFSKRTECVKYVALVLTKIISDNTFDTLLTDFKPEFSVRWSYDKAKELANENYREAYLNIESVEKTDDIDREPFIGIPPADDILPLVDFSILVNKLNDIHNRYLRITRNPLEDQILLENYIIEKQNYKQGIAGFDLVDEKNTFIPLEIIVDLEGIDNPFKYPLINNYDYNNSEKIRSLVTESIYGCNPIRIEYCDADTNTTFRNLTLHSFEDDSIEYFCDHIWKNYYNTKGSKIIGYCTLRGAQRSFFIERIKAIQVFDVIQFGMGHYFSFSTALWYPLKENDLKLCDHISRLIPSELIENDMTTAGNYAHFLLLSEQIEEALNIYRKFDGQSINDELTWREVNLQDFKELSEIADFQHKFDEAIKLLQWQ